MPARTGSALMQEEDRAAVTEANKDFNTSRVPLHCHSLAP